MKNSLDKRTKWCYCIGATGRDAAYALVSMYLLTYVQYTMKLTVAQFGVISAAIVVCLIWDAVNDALMGIIIENTHFKSGKFKPWIIVGAVLNALVIVALFTLRPQGWGFVAFFATGYLLWGMTYTMNDIAYWGMLPSLSSDPKERDTLVTLMSVFICVGQFAVAGIVPTVVAGNAIQAYRVTALIVALAFIAFQTLVVLGVREAPRRDDAEKVTLRKMFTIFMRNDQLVPIGIASLLFNIGNGLLIIFGVNFFYFEFGYADSGDLIFLFTVMYGLGTLFSQALYAFLSSRMHRMTILKICMAAIAVGYGMLMGFGYVLPKNVVLLNAEQRRNALRFPLSPADLHQRADQNPHHVVKKAVTGEQNLDFLPLPLNVDGIDSADGGLFHSRIAAERGEIMLPRQQCRPAAHGV